MPKYQIGTKEPRGVVGSRAARSNDEDAAREEAREYSRARHVKESWLREFADGTLGDIIARYRRGREI